MFTQASGVIYDAQGRAYSVLRAWLNAPASATTQIVPADPDKAIRVLALFMLAGATATTATFESNAAAISPDLSNAANGGAVLPFNAHGWVETLKGGELSVTTGAGSDTGIILLYAKVLTNILNWNDGAAIQTNDAAPLAGN